MDRSTVLRSAYEFRYGLDVADSLLAAVRPATLRQQEHAWRALQKWLTKQPLVALTEPLMLRFFLHLHHQGYAAQTLATYKSALAAPIREAVQIDVASSHFALLLRSFFLRRPPQRSPTLRWDLVKVLSLLQQERFSNASASLDDLLGKCLVLVALATGHRGAEIAAFQRTGFFTNRDGSVTVSLRPGFLFKNEAIDRRPPPVTVRPLSGSPLCPVSCLTEYLRRTQLRQGALFVHPTSRRPLNRGQIALRVCTLIRFADPSGVPQLHDLRRAAASIAWTRRLPMAAIVQRAFWRSSNVFVDRYLRECPAASCVALGTSPPDGEAPQ